MNSSTLKDRGFSQPFALKLVSFSSLPFDSRSVFAIIDTSLTGKAASDILYIGRSKRPTRRILGGYLAGYGGKNTKKISSNLFNNGYIEKTAISWVSCDKPRAIQSELLDKFVNEHGNVPLWNTSKKKPMKIQKVAKVKTKTKFAATTVAKTAKSKAVEKPAPVKVTSQVKPTVAKSTIPPKSPESTSQNQPITSSTRTTSDSTQKTA